ncbi:uncharacterized protein LOC129921779 [Biomphalaria glabrata]|uniref:Uncharacterized protein LOC129921779 n=1 Tax=Biomphalaria glabrata TaxID=6526 RepID=A0A9W2YCU3_BIOGL|nr:uncharacterized protein LOC129921779 [Biomphalaria glabrata]
MIYIMLKERHVLFCLLYICTGKYVSGHSTMKDDFKPVLSLQYSEDIRLISFNGNYFHQFMACLCDCPLFVCNATGTLRGDVYQINSVSRNYFENISPASVIPKQMTCTIDKHGDGIHFHCTPSVDVCSLRLELTTPLLLGDNCLSACVNLAWKKPAFTKLSFVDPHYATEKSCDSQCATSLRKAATLKTRSTSATKLISDVTTAGIEWTLNEMSSPPEETSNRALRFNETRFTITNISLSNSPGSKFNYSFVVGATCVVLLCSIVAIIVHIKRKKHSKPKAKAVETSDCVLLYDNGNKIKSPSYQNVCISQV